MPAETTSWTGRETRRLTWREGTFLVVTGLVLVLCFALAVPFLPAITWAVALAVACDRPFQWLRGKVNRPAVAAGLSVLLITVFLIAPTLLLLQTLGQNLSTAVKFTKDDQAVEKLERSLAQSPQFGPWFRNLQSQVDLKTEVERVGQWVSRRLPSFVSGAVSVLTQVLVMLFALFFLFRDREQAIKFYRRLLPLGDQRAGDLMQRQSDMIHGTFYGVGVVALVQGVLGGIMFWWLGLPAPLVWGAVMAIVAVVPVLGPFIVWVPAAVWLATQGKTREAAILTAWGLLVVSSIDNVLYPVLVGNRIRTHTLLIFFALLGGVALFDLPGLILGPVALITGMALIEYAREREAAQPGNSL